MALPRTRAQDMGLSTKQLLRFVRARLKHIKRASLELRDQLGLLDDGMTESALDQFQIAADKLASELAEILRYHDLPIGQEPEVAD